MNFCEFDKYATQAYCSIHDVDESLNLGDITQVDETELRDFNMICGGSPCFVAGTKIYSNKGYKNIEDIAVGDYVLTHTGAFQKVLNVGMKFSNDIYKIKAQGILETTVTGNHPYYIRSMKRSWNNEKRMYERSFSKPEWKEVKKIGTKDFIGINILKTSENPMSLTQVDCWLLGRYVADGYIRNSIRQNRTNSYNHIVVFCIGKEKIERFKYETSKSKYHIGFSEERTSYKCRIIDESFMNLCLECGKGAMNKHIPSWIMNLPNHLLEEFLNGYMSGDGCYTNNNYKATTISKQLALDLLLCVQKVYRVGARIYRTRRKKKTFIEGRCVNQKDTYEIIFTKEMHKQKNYEVIDDIIWYPVKDIQRQDYAANVYNLEVELDNSYTANNAIVHNCQDFSVAGKQKGSTWTCNECTDKNGEAFEWNPLTVHYTQRHKCPHCGSENIDKSRSSLLVEYLRVIRHNKPNFGIYENVKNIVGKKFKDTFKMFTDELEEYGYSVRWKVLNAKDYGVPQNRERVYLIFIKKDLDNGKFKFPEPFDNGIRLKDVLEPEVDEKYYISDEKVQRFLTSLNNKDALLYDACQVKREGKSREYNEFCPTLTARDYKDPRLVNDNQVKQLGNISESNNGWSNPQTGRIYSSNGVSPMLNTCGGGQREPKILQIGKLNSSQDGVVVSDEGVAPTHTAGHGNTPNVQEMPDYPYCLDANYYKGTTVEQYMEKHRKQSIFEHVRIRKLIPLETFRLMGFSDEDFYKAMIGYSKVAKEFIDNHPYLIGKTIADEATTIQGISNSQLYKMSGNSIVVDVLYYIYVELYKAMPYLFDDLKLSSFFSGVGAFEVALDRLYEGINTGNFTRPQVE